MFAFGEPLYLHTLPKRRFPGFALLMSNASRPISSMRVLILRTMRIKAPLPLIPTIYFSTRFFQHIGELVRYLHIRHFIVFSQI